MLKSITNSLAALMLPGSFYFGNEFRPCLFCLALYSFLSASFKRIADESIPFSNMEDMPWLN
jgi:hypothetical protein